jgi:ArsR family transcriptional regulator
MKALAKVFKALSDPTRLRIMRLLLERDLCVCELMYILRMEQSRISHHVRVLREAGIAEDIRDGRWIIYRIPEVSRRLVEDIFAVALRGRLEQAPETVADTGRLDVCIRENIRGCVCETRPGPEER